MICRKNSVYSVLYTISCLELLGKQLYNNAKKSCKILRATVLDDENAQTQTQKCFLLVLFSFETI